MYLNPWRYTDDVQTNVDGGHNAAPTRSEVTLSGRDMRACIAAYMLLTSSNLVMVKSLGILDFLHLFTTFFLVEFEVLALLLIHIALLHLLLVLD